MALGFSPFTVLPVSPEGPGYTIHAIQFYWDLEMVNLWEVYVQFLLWPPGFVKRLKNTPGLRDFL